VKPSAKPSAVNASAVGSPAQKPSAKPSAGNASAVGSPAQSVGFTLSSLGHAVARRFHSTLEPLHLEPREFALLRAIAPAEGASQQAIGERLQIPPSRMVAFVDSLEQRGLLERRANPDDRRARALYLTGEGRQLLAAAFTLAAELEAELCAQLSSTEREQLLDALGRVGAQLGVNPGAHSAHAD
jgi:DNA-binding MarR family transcriptional regulator